jgi:peptidyl-Asp metalloendopeptidase
MVDSGARFDVLVVYTPAARTAAGGTAAIKNLISLGVSETNTAYGNSGIIPRLRLVYSGEISYTEAASLQTDLSRLQSTSDGYMDTVHTLRNTYGADLVKLVVGAATDACGVAYLMSGSNNTGFASSAFSVTARDCISPNYTFGHELGHNMGSNHAPSDPTGTGAFSYSFGYKDPQARFRTVMAYDCSPSCPRVLHFSNPNVFYNGWVTGTSTQNNATSINNVRTVVANFRAEATPVYEGYLDTANCRSINASTDGPGTRGMPTAR